MAKTGRPSDYDPAFVEQARKLCLLGAIDKDLADFFGVDERTINRWKDDYPAFCQSLKEAKSESDTRVERSLYERATGYSHRSEKIFNADGSVLRADTIEQYPPDPASMIFWLKNRQPAKWRDKHEHEHSGELVVKRVLRGVDP